MGVQLCVCVCVSACRSGTSLVSVPGLKSDVSLFENSCMQMMLLLSPTVKQSSNPCAVPLPKPAQACTGRMMAESPRTSSMANLLKPPRPRGRPRLRYKDVLKRDLAAFGIPNTTWESTASNRSRWRSAIYNGFSTSTQLYIDDCESHRLHRRLRRDGP